MDQIKENKKKIEIKLTNPDKIIYKSSKTTKKEIFDYYQKVASRMLPYIENRLISTVRAPSGTENEKFFKKHFKDNPNLFKANVKKGEKTEDFYYIKDENGLLSEIQMNSIEFHVGAGTILDKNHPNIMVNRKEKSKFIFNT